MNIVERNVVLAAGGIRYFLEEESLAVCNYQETRYSIGGQGVVRKPGGPLAWRRGAQRCTGGWRGFLKRETEVPLWLTGPVANYIEHSLLPHTQCMFGEEKSYRKNLLFLFSTVTVLL